MLLPQTSVVYILFYTRDWAARRFALVARYRIIIIIVFLQRNVCTLHIAKIVYYFYFFALIFWNW